MFIYFCCFDFYFLFKLRDNATRGWLKRTKELELCRVDGPVPLLPDELDSLAAGQLPEGHEGQRDEDACAAQPRDAVQGDAFGPVADLPLHRGLPGVHRLDNLKPLLDDLIAGILPVRKTKVLYIYKH